MKHINFLFSLLLFSHMLLAQDIDACRKVVGITIESINRHSPEPLNSYLSDNFTIAGQKGEIAKVVLKQLLVQLEETVESHEALSKINTNEILELRYTINYKKMGAKEAVFIFDKNNLLQELNLFKMEVKTMSSKSEIQKGDSDIIEVPFTMAGNLIAVDVLLNGEKRKLIFDTGAPKVILNSKYISSKEDKKLSFSASKGIGGNISGMDIAKVDNLNFNGIQLNNQDVITIDLSTLEKELGLEFYGLIGFDLIKDYDLIFDYEKHMLTLLKPNVFEDYKNENLKGNILQRVPFNLEGHIPVIEAKTGDKTLAFGIDSGAESNLISDHLFNALNKEIEHVKTDTLYGADNHPKKVKKGEIKRTEIGSKVFTDLSTMFSNITHLNEGYGLNIDGIIGYEVLSKQKTLISFEREEIIFID